MKSPDGILGACVVLVAVGAPACASSPEPAPPPAATEAESAPPPVASVSASVAPSPPPVAPPAAGRERVAFAVEAKTSIAVTLDVPSAWGIEKHGSLGPSFSNCRNAGRMFGTDISVGAERCEDTESPVDCVNRVVAKRHEANVKDPDKPALRRWVESRRDNDKSPGEFTTEGRLYVADPDHKAVVWCGYMNWPMNPEGDLPAYKDVCSTLTLTPGASPPELVVREPKPEGAAGDASGVEHGEELVKVAMDFHIAIAKGDMKTAKSLIAGPALCAELVADKRGACKTAMNKMLQEIDKELPKLREAASKIEPAGMSLLFMKDSQTKKLPLVMAYPVSKEHPCKSTLEVAWPVTWYKDKAYVLFLMEKKEKPRPKKKK